MLLLNLAHTYIVSKRHSAFTFQYASIKPAVISDICSFLPSFTFQYASIKPKAVNYDSQPHSSFTFQYASIKPLPRNCTVFAITYLHFNMLLLNLTAEAPHGDRAVYLHFNMLLLNLKEV